MIIQSFNIEKYWRVIVCYNIGYNSLSTIKRVLLKLRFSYTDIQNIFNNLLSDKAKAVTCSNCQQHMSVVLFGYHSSFMDYIDTIVHEAEYVKQAMLESYNVDDEEEPPAYTIGYIAKRLLRFFFLNVIFPVLPKDLQH